MALLAHKIRPENIVRVPKRVLLVRSQQVPEYWEENPGGGAEKPWAGLEEDEEGGGGGSVERRRGEKKDRSSRGREQHADAEAAVVAAVKGVDATCPLAGYDADAVEWSLPPALRELAASSSRATAAAAEQQARRSRRGGGTTTTTSRRGGGGGGSFPAAALAPPVDAPRVWATLLSVATLSRFDECVLASRDEEADSTIVDRAWGWLRLQADASPQLSRLLPELQEEARRFVEDGWELVYAIAVRNAREEQLRVADAHALAQATRAAGHMATRALVKHETAACFTARFPCALPPLSLPIPPRCRRVALHLLFALLCSAALPSSALDQLNSTSTDDLLLCCAGTRCCAACPRTGAAERRTPPVPARARVWHCDPRHAVRRDLVRGPTTSPHLTQAPLAASLRRWPAPSLAVLSAGWLSGRLRRR